MACGATHPTMPGVRCEEPAGHDAAVEGHFYACAAFAVKWGWQI